MKQSMTSRIAELERTLAIESDGVHLMRKELGTYKDRIAVIAAENESLRKDKAWLQNMHSCALQAFFARSK